MGKPQNITTIKKERHTLHPIGQRVTNQEGADELYLSAPTITPTALISGTVYKDEDSDGRYDARVDIPIPRAIVSVWLRDEPIAVTHADEKGEYTLSVPAGRYHVLKVSLPSKEECYDPDLKKWGIWSTVEGNREGVPCPSNKQNISVDYRMLNYGPKDFRWQLWHKGPIFPKQNVVLVHGFRFLGSTRRGRCDEQFAKLDDLLQTKEDQYNVWQFEYADGSRGTPDTVAVYASRLGEAADRIRKLTENDTCAVIAYSMGGLVARQYIATYGKSRIDKFLTLATPHMGTLRFEPFNLKWADKLVPRAGAELRPDSRLLWDLNTDVSSSSLPEFAAIGGYSWGRTDGVIEMGSTSLVRSNLDGSLADKLHFVGVKRSHLNINRIGNKKDEVFQLIRSFLHGGVAGISSLRPAEEPKDYNAHFFLTFALKKNPGWQRMIYPSVVVRNTGHRYPGFKVLSQGARTKDGAYIFTVQMQSDDDGEARVYYARGKYATVRVRRGQSTIVSEPIGEVTVLPRATTLTPSLAKATGNFDTFI